MTHALTGEPTRTRKTQLVYNGTTGALTREVFEPGSSSQLVSRFYYDGNGNKNRVAVTANGQTRESKSTYDAFGRLTSSTNALGHKETYQYATKCNAVASQTGPNGLTTKMSYDSFCQNIKTTAPDGQFSQTITTWSSPGEADAGLDYREIGVPLGDRAIYKVRSQDSAGRWSVSYHDMLGRVVRTIKIGQETTYNGKTEVRDIIEDKVYNARGALKAVALPYYEGRFNGDLARWVVYEYDNLGRSVSVVQPLKNGGKRLIKQRYSGFATTEVRADNTTKVTTKNFLDQTVSTKEGGQTISYRYDALGNLTKTNTNGSVITVSYDSTGKNKTKMVDPGMGTWTYAYNGFNELIKQTDNKKQVTVMTYDKLGRMTSRTDQDKTTWVFDKTWKGAVHTEANPNSRVRYHYDKYGRVERTSQTIGGETVEKGFSYDNLGRLKATHYPHMSMVNGYDGGSRLKQISVAKNQLWTYDFVDLEQQLRDTIEYIVKLNNDAIKYEKQVQELILKSTVARREADYYLRLGQSYENRANHYYGMAVSLDRKADSLQHQAKKYRAKSSQYARIMGNMVLELQKVENGNAYYSKTWCTKKNWKGTCKKSSARSAVIPAWMVQYQATWCNKFGCRTGTKTLDEVSPTKLYAKQASLYEQEAKRYERYAASYENYADRLKSIATSYKNRAKEKFAEARKYARQATEMSALLEKIMDEVDHQKEVATTLESNIAALLSDDTLWHLWTVTSRDANGRLEGELFGNGINTKRVFDHFTGDLLQIKSGVADKLIRDIRYGYNTRNSVTSRRDALNNINETFTYDTLDRLTRWKYSNPKGPNQDRRYRYDTRGNMTFKTNAGTMAYDSRNRLTSRTHNGKKVTYRYDQNGNMLKGDGRTYNWNRFNKARSVVTAKGATHYTYGGNHSRVKKEVNGVTTYYFGRDYEVTVEKIKGKTVRTMRHHIFAGHELVATHKKVLNDDMKQTDTTAYVHRDALGSVDTVTNQVAEVVQQQRYTPFGEAIAVVGAKNTFETKDIRGYTSHENVGDTGLINMNARLYDPLIGRFVQADTLIPDAGTAQDYNRYAYVRNNPMKYSDPSGHFPFLLGLGLFLFSMTTDDPFLQKVTGLAGNIIMGGALSSLGYSAIQNGAIIVVVKYFRTT